MLWTYQFISLSHIFEHSKGILREKNYH